MPDKNQISWLPTGITKDVDVLVGSLKEIQQKCSTARFHLLMETDLDQFEHIRRGETRVLFSPTISFDSDSASMESQSRAQELVCALRSVSVLAMAMTNSHNLQVSQRHRVTANPPTNKDVIVPVWFPGRAYSKATLQNDELWKKMKEEKLVVKAEFASRFCKLPLKDLRDLYQSFLLNYTYLSEASTDPWSKTRWSMRDLHRRG